jgi:archaeosine synthase beta-subunit
MQSYPKEPVDRDRWILEQRPVRNDLDPQRPYAFHIEDEVGPDGKVVRVATLFLTNRECPWRCLMCDLWRNTLEENVPEGAIPEQIRYALDRLPSLLPEQSDLKLYNAGSFFDPRAIPPRDYAEIARLCAPFPRTIVECHPALVGRRCLEFRDLLSGRLEVAMGLETAHPEVLERLNKRMTLDQFRRAADFLRSAKIDLRVFILARPPWLSEDEGVEWAMRSLDFAFDCGAIVCSLIPTRAGNGAMDALHASGEFSPPTLRSLESAQEYGLWRRLDRVFVDMWDIEKLVRCPACDAARIERLRVMNRTQSVPPWVQCNHCEPA